MMFKLSKVLIQVHSVLACRALKGIIEENNNVVLLCSVAQVQDLTQVLPVSSSNAPLLNALLAGVNAAGQTFLSGGLNRGVEQQRDAPGGKIKSVYLFTDGLPTVGKVLLTLWTL